MTGRRRRKKDYNILIPGKITEARGEQGNMIITDYRIPLIIVLGYTVLYSIIQVPLVIN